MSLFDLRASLLSSNLKNFFSRSPLKRERAETEALVARATGAFVQSHWETKETVDRFLVSIMTSASEGLPAAPSHALAMALYTFGDQMMEAETSFYRPPELQYDLLTLEQQIRYRADLKRQIAFLSGGDKHINLWGNTLRSVIQALVDLLPSSVLVDADEDGLVPDEAPRLQVALVDLLADPPDVIEGMMAALYDDKCLAADFFASVRRTFRRNLLIASQIDPDGVDQKSKPLITPRKAKAPSTRKLVETYCARTPLYDLLNAPLPFAIPFPLRFEHTHIVGGSGHGKTQLLQLLLAHDLSKSREDGRSVVVIDSQGDLIRNIANLELFSPHAENSLSDRMLIIDPTDVEFPPCLNMFDWNRGRIESLRPLDRERMLNGTIDLYEYLFGALLGAELTQRQGVIFKYIARLMMEIPGATIQTLRQLMEDGERFRPYMEKLPGSARAFFETRFFDRSFNETKKQILTRLWGVLSNGTFERMFSHERNKVDMYEAMSTGKIVLINTAKDLLTHDGAAIFGRFFIALIAQAALQRSALAPHERTPAFVYVDEAQDYFDDKVGHLLNQARKYRVGMILAHQNLDQLSTGLRASIMTSASIKLAGGVSSKDARAFAEDMHCDPEFIQGMKKRREQTEFACFVRNFTPRAVQVSVPLGYLESLPKLGEEQRDLLIAENRRLYCASVDEVNRLLSPPEVAPRPPSPPPTSHDVPTTRATPPQETLARPSRPARRVAAALQPPETDSVQEIAPKSGRGGMKHRYLQYLVKGLGEERGFRALIEEEILEGGGRVDVALMQPNFRIACEVTVTTGSDQELRNVEKCLAAKFDHVIVLADEQRHLTAIKKAISRNLQEAELSRVSFCLGPDVAALLDNLSVGQPTEELVRGYKVRTTRTILDPIDSETRKRAIATVLTRSVARLKDKGSA